MWIQNVFDADNVVTVYRSTGSSSTTDWLNTSEAQATAQAIGQGYVQDYRTLEQNPDNYGIPRLIRLGLQVDISHL